MELIYEDLIRNNKDAFKQKVSDVADALGINPNSLMMVMKHESGLNPAAQNTQYPFADGYATGLIQFIPSTARHLGTSTEALKRMSNVDQMYYVYKYYEPFKDLLKSKNLLEEYTKLHLITFYPNADGIRGNTLNKPDDWAFPDVVYRNNPHLDYNKDGILTIEDYKNVIFDRVPDEWKVRFKAPTFMAGFLGGRAKYVLVGILVIVILAAIATRVEDKKKRS